ncbi:MAG: glycosyltransferase family 4 protein [Phycisphaerales bacterium]|nr:glycosyltransferase family 4 protein [Phycisphaerales bacterium]
MLIDTMPSYTPPIEDRRSPLEPVRVLHVAASLFAGGMERSLVRLLKHTPESMAHDVCILKDGDESLIDQCRGHASTHILHGSRWAWRKLRRISRSTCPKVVHARGTSAWVDAVLATRGLADTRLILSFHGRTHIEPVSSRRRWLNRLAANRADAVVAVSEDAADMLHREWSIDREKVCVIPNGIDPVYYYPVESHQDKEQLRRELGLDEGTVPVLCVANLLPIKGLDVLLAAWRKVCLADRSAILLIVGEGPLDKSLCIQAEQLRCASRVRFLGRREDVPALLRAAELFVLPSRYEGSSNALLEAMACGLPVIATDVGGNREVLDPNRTGWLVPADDAGRLAEMILNTLLASAVRQRVGTAAREEILRRFSLKQWIERYHRLYRSVAERKGTVGHGIMEELVCAE